MPQDGNGKGGIEGNYTEMLLATVVAAATAVLVIGAKAAVRYFIRKENENGKDHA